MNSKSINHNVWALTLSLCLGVIGYSTLSAQAADPQKTGERRTPTAKQPPSVDLGRFVPTAAQLETIKKIPNLRRMNTTNPNDPSPNYIAYCGELTINCGDLGWDDCIRVVGAACGAL